MENMPWKSKGCGLFEEINIAQSKSNIQIFFKGNFILRVFRCLAHVTVIHAHCPLDFYTSTWTWRKNTESPNSAPPPPKVCTLLDDTQYNTIYRDEYNRRCTISFLRLARPAGPTAALGGRHAKKLRRGFNILLAVCRQKRTLWRYCSCSDF